MIGIPLWLIYALLAAVAASSIWIFGKVGMGGIDADIATAVRSVVQVAFVLAFAGATGKLAKVSQFAGRHMAIVAVILSGVAGGLSWIFSFRALALAAPSQVAPIDKLSVPITVLLGVVLLNDRPSGANWMGVAMIAAGAYLAALRRG